MKLEVMIEKVLISSNHFLGSFSIHTELNEVYKRGPYWFFVETFLFLYEYVFFQATVQKSGVHVHLMQL